MHYRWVNYAGEIELMSFVEGDCVWRFGLLSILSLLLGSIDPSKPRTDILSLDGVVADDPSTYNETFYIRDENNICVGYPSVSLL